MTNIPKWIDDLDKSIVGLPFGEVSVIVHRHRSRTDKVTYVKHATIAPKSNEIAFSDLETLINAMITAFFSGKVEFALDFEKGTIKLITIKNKETKIYGNQNRT